MLNKTSIEKIEELKNILDNIDTVIPEEFPLEREVGIFGGVNVPQIYGTVSMIEFQHKGMFSLVSYNWIRPLSEWIGSRKCLEVMSGRGFLTKALRELNVDIVATDDYSWGFNDYNNPVTEVEDIDAVESIKKYIRDVDILIISWPPMDQVAYEVVKKARELNPDIIVIYIGEDEGGCTASESFFEIFDTNYSDEKFNEVSLVYPTWRGFHDTIMLGSFNQ